MKKYELTSETRMLNDGTIVYRIRSLKNFKTIIDRDVKIGDLGGFLESEKNMSHDGLCWVFDEAVGCGNSCRSGNSVGYGNSVQKDNSRQIGNSRQSGKSWQFGNSVQSGDSWQSGNSRQFGNSRQSGNSWQFGDSMQFGNSRQFDNSMQFGSSMQSGDSRQSGNSRQIENSWQSGNSRQTGDSRQSGYSRHDFGTDDGIDTVVVLSGNFGEQKSITIQPDLMHIVCGRFSGTFDEFRLNVINKYGEAFGDYKSIIKFLDLIKGKSK